MAQAVQTVRSQAPAPHISDTLKASLCSLTRRIGPQKAMRNPASLRSKLASLGDDAEVRAGLEQVVAGPQKATVRDFAVCLGKLALHYWRPDFTPEQAKQMYGDFVTDLDGVTAQELADACQEWRLDPLNRFFPTPGQLRELVRDRLTDRKVMAAGAAYLLEILDQPAAREGEAPISDRLHELAEKMKAANPASRPEPEPVHVAIHPKAGRSQTDPAELKAALAKRMGVSPDELQRRWPKQEQQKA